MDPTSSAPHVSSTIEYWSQFAARAAQVCTPSGLNGRKITVTAHYHRYYITLHHTSTMGCFGSKDKKPKGGNQGNAGTGTKPTTTNNNPPATQLQEKSTTNGQSTNKNRSILYC
jgi:hypothetical protein